MNVEANKGYKYKMFDGLAVRALSATGNSSYKSVDPSATSPAGEWYAIHTRPRHEKRVAEELRLRSVEEFLPVHRCRHKWNNGVVADLQLPLFPGYLFARFSGYERLRLLQVPGILGLAVTTSRPTAVPEEAIQTLRALTDTLRVEPHPFLNEGDRVRIIAGPLAGMEGILTRRKQELRVVLSLEIIMRSIAVEVSELDIEPVGLRN
jgi:transcription antitermination factor NusG